MSNHPAYEKLAPSIQRALYKKGWETLRPLQEQAIHILCGTESDLLISAQTAAGKTEAAFLPILSLIQPNSMGSVRAIYVGPLKALINDQFRRLEDLCQYAEIPVHRWHGDVSSKSKKELVKCPGGVLLITPESLESIFINRSESLRHLFHSLSYIVLDEVHSMHGSERGTHLRSLLSRLDHYTITQPRLVGLSATIGAPEQTCHWMRPDQPERVKLLLDENNQKSVRFGLFAYFQDNEELSDDSKLDESKTATGKQALINHVFQSFSREKNLIFVNARAGVEFYTDELNRRAKSMGKHGQFLIHHGSLSKEIRQHTEKMMLGRRPYSTVCSATLELGIDIGNVRSIAQIGCPWSVSSLLQRLGRSGREEGASQRMQLYVVEPLPIGKNEAKYYPELIQAIALTELMLEKWVEPPLSAVGDLSTLIHQVLSLITETGGVSALMLYRRLIKAGAFRSVPQEVFIRLLKKMGQEDLVEQTEEGDLILGLKGEIIVRSHDFYAAFSSTPEFRVVFQSRPLGRLPTIYVPEVGSHLLLAGRRWRVLEVDHTRREIAVKPAQGRKQPLFTGGNGVIHRRVRQKMRDVLSDQAVYAYLNPTGKELLEAARQEFVSKRLQQTDLLPLSDSKTIWFPWTGSHIQSTLVALLKHHRMKVTEGLFSLEIEMSETHFRNALRKIVNNLPKPELIAPLLSHSVEARKYDEFLDDWLREWSICQDIIDLEGAAIELQNALKSAINH
ncbi:MAG TPA: DEAD/DEAH box helicase [Planctomycetaceae bacterium]|nr:DEAD/DEAH box helicase [Planctomycetaceae bacterium]